jgi:putative acetyltransferase
MLIRKETSADIQAIHEINRMAFDTEAEANLVDALRSSGVHLISLVAEDSGVLIGHILFSPVSITGWDGRKRVAGLAPMAVLPEWKGQGVGSMLVEKGLSLCLSSGYDAVVVLGYPEYYRRFGFVPSVEFNLRSEYGVPDDVFMVVELIPGALKGVNGTVKYHAVFNDF